jgi:hypothetical protein
MARPRKEINWEIVEKMIEAGSSARDIYGKFRINEDTFYRRFKDEYEISFQDYKGELSSAGEADLRLMLHAKALNNDARGNITALIFLARTRLGMREPELLSQLPSNQGQIDQSHLIMQLQYEIEQLKNANKSKAE